MNAFTAPGDSITKHQKTGAPQSDNYSSTCSCPALHYRWHFILLEENFSKVQVCERRYNNRDVSIYTQVATPGWTVALQPELNCAFRQMDAPLLKHCSVLLCLTWFFHNEGLEQWGQRKYNRKLLRWTELIHHFKWFKTIENAHIERSFVFF